MRGVIIIYGEYGSEAQEKCVGAFLGYIEEFLIRRKYDRTGSFV